jgi:pantoate--beta-alanine ligase
MGIQVANTIAAARAAIAALRADARGASVGFVPTMGALHAGHRSLIERSARENDVTVVSIFVNPTQFSPGEDFEKYPKTTDADIGLCEAAGADIVFLPRADEIYPDGFSSQIDMTGPTEALCGLTRPGHFRGVMTVVAKLFNIVRPDRAYFGEKDAQQLVVIRKLARDLNMGIEIVGCPTIREDDGLAMSSRNAYLSPEERRAARCVPRALELGRYVSESNSASPDAEDAVNNILDAVRTCIEAEPLARLEYAELLDASDLSPVTDKTKLALLAVAVHIGGTRLIDNTKVRWRG